MASLPTVADIKKALGIPDADTSKDEAIESMLAATIALIETYLGRGIAQANEVQEFIPPDSRNPVLSVFRFPIQLVNSVTQEAATISGWRVYREAGQVKWKAGACYMRRACCGEDDPPVMVDYVGGYADDAWPADLAEAVMRAFYVRWNATGGTGNTADVVNAPGNNRSVSVDGLTITRDSQMWAGDAFGGVVVPPELTGVAAMLERYKVHTVTGV